MLSGLFLTKLINCLKMESTVSRSRYYSKDLILCICVSHIVCLNVTQVAEIYSACDNPSVKRALFGATLACGVEEFCHIHFDSPVRVTIGVE